MARAIAAFERTYEFAPFNSKFDLYLAGEVELTAQEMHGLEIFEAEDKGNCAACHPSTADHGIPPLFTDFTYDNLGVPRNPANPFLYLDRELNPDGLDWVDPGLAATVDDPGELGKFRVPTLRNVAVTGPYMHNGVFNTLWEVVAFYNTRDVASWPAPEVFQNLNREELGDLGLTNSEMEDLVAFLGTLTDGYDPDESATPGG
jgi:cytochrome c peroxidase